MQNLDKDHIAQEAAFHMACHNEYVTNAKATRERAERTDNYSCRLTFESMAKAYDDIAQEHLDLYNQKMKLMEGPDSFTTQLLINSCGILIQKHSA